MPMASPRTVAVALVFRASVSPSFPRSGFAGEVVELVCRASFSVLVPPAGRGGEGRTGWRPAARFVAGDDGGLLRIFCSGRPWWRGEQGREVVRWWSAWAALRRLEDRMKLEWMRWGRGLSSSSDSAASGGWMLRPFYNVWRRLLSGGKWYGDSGGA